mmetsp:Transcript_12769/g.29437  ORF Transcript_12769/g.29437 Transcript_12769/m.29437 type:complete len:397 (-) Transcript_12769:52-1242(-)
MVLTAGAPLKAKELGTKSDHLPAESLDGGTHAVEAAAQVLRVTPLLAKGLLEPPVLFLQTAQPGIGRQTSNQGLESTAHTLVLLVGLKVLNHKNSVLAPEVHCHLTKVAAVHPLIDTLQLAPAGTPLLEGRPTLAAPAITRMAATNPTSPASESLPLSESSKPGLLESSTLLAAETSQTASLSTLLGSDTSSQLLVPSCPVECLLGCGCCGLALGLCGLALSLCGLALGCRDCCGGLALGLALGLASLFAELLRRTALTLLGSTFSGLGLGLQTPGLCLCLLFGSTSFPLSGLLSSASLTLGGLLGSAIPVSSPPGILRAFVKRMDTVHLVQVVFTLLDPNVTVQRLLLLFREINVEVSGSDIQEPVVLTQDAFHVLVVIFKTIVERKFGVGSSKG